jgi:TrmH family RNA methyltransferase
MLSKNKINHLTSLQNKKFREQFCEFLIEGDKIVKESLAQDKYRIIEILALPSWINQNAALLSLYNSFDITIISEKDLERISSFKSPNQVIARLSLKEEYFDYKVASAGLTVYLDGIQDPGNAGTIVRTAEWYGVKQVIFSPDSVDRYNSKFLQACMGSQFRVSLLKISFEEFKRNTLRIHWWGASLTGINLNENIPDLPGILVMGNEGSGIRPEIHASLDFRFMIPKHENAKTESLNVAVATGIILDKIMTR